MMTRNQFLTAFKGHILTRKLDFLVKTSNWVGTYCSWEKSLFYFAMINYQSFHYRPEPAINLNQQLVSG